MTGRATLFDLLRDKLAPGESLRLHVCEDELTFIAAIEVQATGEVAFSTGRPDPIAALRTCLERRSALTAMGDHYYTDVQFWIHEGSGRPFTTSTGEIPAAPGCKKITRAEYETHARTAPFSKTEPFEDELAELLG